MRAIFKNAAGQIRAGWRLAMWFAIVIALQFGIDFGVGLLHLHTSDAFLDPVNLLVGDWLFTFIPVMVATLVMGRIEHRRLRDYYIPGRGLLGGRFWMGSLWGFAAVSLLIGLIALAGGYRITGLALTEHRMYWVLIWMVTAASIGIVEEIAFRGYMLRTLADGIGFWPAAVILAVGFGALHYFGKPHERWEDFASVTLLALFMSLTIVRTGSLAWAMGWHFAFDWGAMFFWSGRNAGEYAPGRLFATDWPGNDRVTGGLLGPEASWWVFLVVVVLFVSFDRLYRQRKLEF